MHATRRAKPSKISGRSKSFKAVAKASTAAPILFLETIAHQNFFSSFRIFDEKKRTLLYEENDILKLEEFHIFDKKNHGPLFQLLALFILDFDNIIYWNDISSRPGKIFLN